MVYHKDFEKSETELETFKPIEELNYPPEFASDFPIVFILDDLNKKEINDTRAQGMFKRSRGSNFSSFIFGQDYYELPKRTVHAIDNNYHIFKANNFRDVQHLYQDEASMDLTPNKFILLTSTYRNEKHQPLTNDMIKIKYTGHFR